MERQAISGIMLKLLLIGMLTLASNIQTVKASGTIFIRADGSIDPPTASISTVDNVTYTLTRNIYDSIVVERDNIVVEGADYTVQGTGSGTGIDVADRRNVTLKNMQIKAFEYAICLWGSSDNSVFGNNINANNYDGILLSGSSNNSIVGNNITNNRYGIILAGSSDNSVFGNNINANNWDGIYLYYSSNNSIVGNNITNNYYDIWLDYSSGNSIVGNNITNNRYGIILAGSSNYNSITGNNVRANNWQGIRLSSSSNNSIYHNNFLNNTEQVHSYNSINVWDDGYPSGGNYWSDCFGTDFYGGPYQSKTGSDGIGDTPYIIDANNQDNYALMGPISIFNAGTWNATTYYVHIISNSTLSDFYFNPDEGAFVRFGVSGETETVGFCRVAIPKDLLWEDGWTIYYGSVTVNYTAIQDENYTYLYFTYQHYHCQTTIEILGTKVIEEEKILLGSGWGWMRIEANESVHGGAELYEIGDGKMELIITCEGETYSRTWNIVSHREYKYGERYLCYSEEWGFLNAGFHKHRRRQFWHAVGKGVAAFGFPRLGRLRLMSI